MKKLSFVTLLLCVAQLLQAAKVDKNVNLTIDGETRNYQLYVPDNVQANCPLVLSLHGANGHSTDRSPFRTDVADKEGCIVVYPQGKTTDFPIGFGGSTTGWTASGEENFDVKFLKAVIDDVASNYQIDRKRIYCCGFSNGGMMTYAMSNACSDVIAAFASISGYPINEFHLRHTGDRPVPFLHIHGKNDDFVLYEKMPTIVDEMVARLGANPVPVKTTVSGKYTKSVYKAGEGSFPYVYYEIDGMGHNDFTANTEDGNSAQTMWNFFEQYTLDSPCDPTLKWRPNIETQGYAPNNHGWTMNSGTTLLEFGGDQYTSENKNVYRSLQFDSGKYELNFKSTGAAGKTITVKIEKLTDSKKTVLNTTVNVGKDVKLPFEVTDGWGEYKLTITRPSSSDNITISDIAIKQTGEAETTPSNPIGKEFTSVADLNGKTFVIVNKDEGKAICNKQKYAPYDLQYLDYADAFSSDVSGYLFRIEQINDPNDAAANGKYLIRCLKGDGSEYSNGGDPYFQTNITGNGVCFFYSLSFGSTVRGLDANNTGAWDIQYDTEHAAFTLKNVYTGKYYNVPTKDAMSDTPGYFTFCELYEYDVITTYEVENELTSIAENDVVAIYNATSDKFLYGTSAQGLGYETEDKAFITSNSGWLFKVQKYDGHFLFHLQNPTGSDYNLWGSTENSYLNTQKATQNDSFILGLSGEYEVGGEKKHYIYGQDLDYGALWDIEAVEGGFKLKNVGTELYLKGNRSAKFTEADADVWKFVTLKETTVTNPIPRPNRTATDALVLNLNNFGGAEWTNENKEDFKKTKTFAGKCGFSWTEGIDLSQYQYLVVTSGKNVSAVGYEVSITDNLGKTVKGDEYGASYMNMWFGAWNNHNCLCIDLEKLRTEIQFNVYSITDLTINGNNGFTLGTAYATNQKPNNSKSWNDEDNGDYKISSLPVGKIGTICLPWQAAVAGAFVYEIAGKNSEGIELSRVEGLLEAGKPYFYENNGNDAGAETNNIYFYKATAATAEEAIENNGLIGTFTDGTVPQGNNFYVVGRRNGDTEDKIFQVDSEVSLPANRAYIDKSKIQSTSASRTILLSFDGEENEATAIESPEVVDVVANAVFYDMSGREVKPLTSGIYIVKYGNLTKKVMIK